MFINCQQLAIYSFQHWSHILGSLSVHGFHLHYSQCKTALLKFQHHWSPIGQDHSNLWTLSITLAWYHERMILMSRENDPFHDITREWSWYQERMILFMMSQENDPLHDVTREWSFSWCHERMILISWENDPFHDVTREWSSSWCHERMILFMKSRENDPDPDIASWARCSPYSWVFFLFHLFISN